MCPGNSKQWDEDSLKQLIAVSCRKDVPVSVKGVDWVQQGAECCGGIGHNGNILPRAKFMALHKDL